MEKQGSSSVTLSRRVGGEAGTGSRRETDLRHLRPGWEDEGKDLYCDVKMYMTI